MAAPKTTVEIVFGAMSFGAKGMLQSRVHNLEDAGALLDVFQKYGHKRVDTARLYSEGTSEQMLGELNWQQRGLIMDTKLFPTVGRVPTGLQISHGPEDLRTQLLESLKTLKTDKIDTWFLHGPDRTTPYEVTLEAVNALYKEGCFKHFGLSNYMAWEVAQICEICKAKNYLMPSVYQGIYNAFHRTVEAELFPCLRHYGLAYQVYNPLAAGYLTSRYHRDTGDNVEEGTRFDPKTFQGKYYRAKYWNDAMFDALDLLRPVAKKHSLTEAECALRWLSLHSLLKREKGDAILVGASNTKQMEENLTNSEKGPLPEEVVEALNAGWERVRGTPSSLVYWY